MNPENPGPEHPGGIVVRSCSPKDVLSLKRLLVQLGYPEQDEAALLEKVGQHNQEGYQLLIAESDQEILGFIAMHWFHLLHLSSDIGRITAFCVDERFRSQGVGIALLQAAETIFQQEGCKKIEVTSNARRTETHAFYLKRGYLEDSKRFVRYL